MISVTITVGDEVREAVALVSCFGSLGAEVTGVAAWETLCIQSVTWTSKCLIPACKRQTGSSWRRYRGIDVTVVLGPGLSTYHLPRPGSL